MGERDYSAQEICHLLLQLPLMMSSREFVYLSLGGTCMVEEKPDEDEPIHFSSNKSSLNLNHAHFIILQRIIKSHVKEGSQRQGTRR